MGELPSLSQSCQSQNILTNQLERKITCASSGGKLKCASKSESVIFDPDIFRSIHYFSINFCTSNIQLHKSCRFCKFDRLQKDLAKKVKRECPQKLVRRKLVKLERELRVTRRRGPKDERRATQFTSTKFSDRFILIPASQARPWAS